MTVALAAQKATLSTAPMRKVIVILGVPVDDLDMDETLDRICTFVETGRRTGRTHQVVTVNADFVVNAIKDPEVRFIMQEADLATADGMPIVWGAHLLGVNLSDRVAGADLVPLLAERAARQGYSIFLLGAGPGVAAQAADILCERYPGLKIAGVLAPPFRPVLEMDSALVEAVKAARPDILMVAFGNPKQEKWIAMHRQKLGVPVMIGIGGSLDFLTGTTQRAPKWMQRIGLEWFHRLLQDPKRMWRRYVSDFFVFGIFLLRQWWAMQSHGKPPAALPAQSPVVIGRFGILPVRGKLAVQNLESFSSQVQRLLAETPHLVIDLSRAEFLDSSAVGTLIHFAKEARAEGGDLILAAVPEPIYQTLRLLRLDQYFVTAPSAAAVVQPQPYSRNEIKPAANKDKKSPGTIQLDGSTWAVISLPRRLDGSTAEAVRQTAQNTLKQASRLILDFSSTVFLASAGLAALADLHRQSQEIGGKMVLTGCSRDVSRVIQLARFDQFLTIEPHIAALISAD